MGCGCTYSCMICVKFCLKIKYKHEFNLYSTYLTVALLMYILHNITKLNIKILNILIVSIEDIIYLTEHLKVMNMK